MIALSDAYSSSVKASLLVGDHIFDVAQVRPGKCVVRNPASLGPVEGELVLQVDDDVYRHRVYLTNGMSADSRDVAVENRQ